MCEFQNFLNDMVSLKEYVLNAIGPSNLHISPNYDKNDKKSFSKHNARTTFYAE